VSVEKVRCIADQMLSELYSKATPPARWDEIKKKYAGTKIRFFELHYLPLEDSEKILNKYQKKVRKFWRNSLALVWLDFAPTTVRGVKKKMSAI